MTGVVVACGALLAVGFSAAPKPVNVEEEVAADDPCAGTALQVRVVASTTDDADDNDADDEAEDGEGDEAGDDDGNSGDDDAPATPASSAPAAADCGESFDGPAVSNIKGTYQARIVVLEGQVIDVVAVVAGTSAPESIAVNAMAIPAFKERVLSAQTWDVEAVSGASYTSPAFLESLEGAFGAAGLG